MPVLMDKLSKRMRKVHDFWSSSSRGVAGALEDEEEGEPEELFDDVASNVPLHTSIVKGAGHWWGSFRFDHVRRVITKGKHRGKVEMQWQVTCPYHNDPDDNAATKCRKTKGYEGQDQSVKVCRQLRQWCLDGRRCTSRKSRVHGQMPHLKEKLKKIDFIDDEILAAELELGLADESWFLSDLEPPHRQRRRPSRQARSKAAPASAPASRRPSQGCSSSSSSSSKSSSSSAS